MIKRAAILFLFFLAPALFGQQLIAIKARWMFDGHSDQLRENVMVVVEDGRIRSAGNLVPDHAAVIDLGRRP